MKKMYNILPVLALIALIYGSGTDPAELSTVKADQQETNFGDLTADALAHVARLKISLVAAVSFKPGAIAADNLTSEQIAGLLHKPEEGWAVSKLTGAQLRATLERGLSRLPLPSTAFLQVSGLKVRYNPQAPRGSRIIALTTTKGTKGPVDDTKEYQVVMPLSLAKGGSGYFQIFDQDNILRRGSDGLSQVITTYLSTQENIEYTGQNRIMAITAQ